MKESLCVILILLRLSESRWASMRIHAYPFVSLHIPAYPCITMHIPAYLCISTYIPASPRISLHIPAYPYISMHIPAYPRIQVNPLTGVETIFFLVYLFTGEQVFWFTDSRVFLFVCFVFF